MVKKALFDTFPKIELAQELIQVLKENKIEYSLVENSHDVDITFTGNTISEIQLLLDPEDFLTVHQLRKKQVEDQIDVTDQSHYFHNYRKEELYEVLKKQDEWSAYDFAFAKKLLISQGKKIGAKKIEAFVKQREVDLSIPDKSPKLQLILGYFFAFLGGLIGLLIGWYLWRSKKNTSQWKKNSDVYGRRSNAR